MRTEHQTPDWSDRKARSEYIRRLRKEIREGTYNVPAEWVAEKILDTERSE